MKTSAKQKLDKVLDPSLLKNVGLPLKDATSIIANWHDALEKKRHQKWANCRLMARNRLQRLIELQSWEFSEEWNPLIDDLGPVVRSEVSRIVKSGDLPAELVEIVSGAMTWDLLGICLETYYEDIIAPPFYVPYIEPWYAKGHFPCGWTGKEFPSRWDGSVRDGQVEVY